MPLTEEAIEQLKHELVVVTRDGEPTYFMHYQFLAAQQQEQLARLSELVPEGSTPRRAARALQTMKTPEDCERVLQRALRRLIQDGDPVEVEDREAARERVVALFLLRT